MAAVEGAANANESRWHEALGLALNHDLRLIAVDALEGLGVTASHDDSWSEALRLLASADRLRDETGYRWRFRVEQQAVDNTRAAAHKALGDAETMRPRAKAAASTGGNQLTTRAEREVNANGHATAEPARHPPRLHMITLVTMDRPTPESQPRSTSAVRP